MSEPKAYDEPTKVAAVDGEVTLDGPDGVAVSMTPSAARETARRLLDGAEAADGQPPPDEDAPPVDDFA